MFKNFSIFSSSGRVLYNKNFEGQKLDQSFTLVFASSLLNFSKTLFGEEAREVTTQQSRIYLKEVGEVKLHH
jgi:hypothetical protein